MSTAKIPEELLIAFEGSLQRCTSVPDFLDRFYETFLASAPEVREKFAHTDFVHQKRALRASFHLILLAASDREEGPETYLQKVAERHSRKGLDIGAAMYDLWLDSLLATIEACDPEYDARIAQAWERVMGVGIEYLVNRYHR